MLNRINKELQDLTSNPPEGCSISLVNDDLCNWRVTLLGPSGSPYAGGRFNILLTLPANYPFRPPDAKFISKIYHVNVNKADGSICADIFQNSWAPTLNMRYVVESLVSILMNPAPEHAVEPDIAAQMLNDPQAFHATAQQWVRNYAN